MRQEVFEWTWLSSNAAFNLAELADDNGKESL
jgi:hypothetical protein